MGFSQLRALSAAGRARPFDAAADGLVVGEAAGMFVLKRLSDAIRQGDTIYGLVAAVGLSNDVDGGLLAPSTEGQLRALRSSYKQAGWDPRDISLIECHATGTPVGDAVEVASLKALWGESGWRPHSCVIGSHKGNIGHALTASGAAGLMKLLLALGHKTLPPTAGFVAPASTLKGETPFRILQKPEPWISDGPRRAGISGFGFGGINAHVLIEEWTPAEESSTSSKLAGSRPRQGEVSDRASTSQGLDPSLVNGERSFGTQCEIPPAVAIIGLSAHAGRLRGLRPFQEWILSGGEIGRAENGNDWGLFDTEWVQEEGIDGDRLGLPVEEISLRLDRFRIPPKELGEMLPQQLFALIAAADAIEDAGWDDRARPRAGVFIGIGLDLNTTNFHVRWNVINQARNGNVELGLNLDGEALEKWTAELRNAAGPPLTANRTMGALGGLIASRIAREFRIGGPSFTVSSEETSGLRALDIAVGLLERGELDEAVVGAVDLTSDPRWRIEARRSGIPDLARIDASTALVVKRLVDAERDGDRIYCVIRGIGVATHGSIDSKKPSSVAAGTAARRAGAGSSVDLLEQSGSERMRSEHAGAADGLLAFVRTVICLYQQILPPTDRAPARFWLRDRADGPRRAEVTSSGVGGDTVHVVVEEHEGHSPRVELERSQPLGALPLALFAVEAEDRPSLLCQLDRLESVLTAHADSAIEVIARRWWTEEPNDPKKRLGLAIVADDPGELASKIAAARRWVKGIGPAVEGVSFGTDALGASARVAFVYPGFGNAFAGMARELGVRWPEILRRMDSETLRLRSQLDPKLWWTSERSAPDQCGPILGQVVFGSAMTDLLALFGIAPDAVVGYSLGESSALFATRAWTERDLMHERLDASPLFRTDLCGPRNAARDAWGLHPDEPVDWSAGLVPVPAERVSRTIAELGLNRVHVLIVNAPEETVVGGQRNSVDRLVESLGVGCVPLLDVSTVHCGIVRNVQEAYRNLHLLETHPPEGVSFYSTSTGLRYIPDRESAAEAIVGQAVDTIDFPAVIRRAYDDGIRLFVEVGPGRSCTRMIRATLRDRPHVALWASDPNNGNEVRDVFNLLAAVIAERIPVNLAALYGRPTQAVGLVDTKDDPSRRLLHIPVGGRPFAIPPTPARSTALEPPDCLEACPTVIDPIPDPLTSRGHAASLATLDRPWLHIADPFADQLLANETSRGVAHEAFLRLSSNLAQTMSNHLAFQMALVETLMASPEAGETSLHVAHAESPTRPALDREQCLEFAVGSIANALGPEFAPVDTYPTRVRLPDEPLMLVDRIMTIEGEPRSMTSGRVVTEHDVKPGAWYLDAEKMVAAVAIESGQADLFLSGYLGIDFATKGKAVYRLLDAVVTFHRGLPEPGDVISYDITISRFFRQGDTHLFRFQFEATIDGVPLLSMRDGCAGFFTSEEIAAGKGIVHTALDLRPMPGIRPDDWVSLASMSVRQIDDTGLEALRQGDLATAFGQEFARLNLRDPIRLPGGRLALLDRIASIDPSGGRFGLGLIRSELDIQPNDWFLTCHFIDDQVMPGTLMYECCLQTLRVFLMSMGWASESDGVAFEPVPGVFSRLKCRGQVTASTSRAVFELSLKELGYGPEPFAIADALMLADGKPIVEVLDMSIRLTGLTRDDVEQLWCSSVRSSEKSVLFSKEQVLTFAEGKPSEAFGDRYKPFDSGRVIARLPAPPYSFIDRVTEIQAEPWVMVAGGSAEVEYDVPPEAWYFASNRQERMPFAVLLEVPLQACGWLAAYVGSALASEDDLAFRNLGGTGTLLSDVTATTGTLTSRVTMTRVSRSGGMIIQNFVLETWAGTVLVYRGESYFGFFRHESLADQVGIREATPYQPGEGERVRSQAFEFPTVAPFPDSMLRMIDRVTLFVPDGGPNGLGFIEGTLAVDPSAWFFKAHFLQDPVCPGSLGLESLLQLLKVVAVERWGEGLAFEPIGTGDSHRWTYRGQIVPRDRLVTTQAIVTAVDDARRWLRADGFLSVDGRIIYQMNDFTLRAV
jgi:acyl transferase domain-containing protein/3-hydroxymyristoyl/3-hydroxydecanoyl-(acyl carrier protein) dehydratase